MANPAYPTNIKVYMDDQDITKFIFGADTITLTDLNHIWQHINITPYLRYAGQHKLKITAEAGVGRVDARITIK